jgi:hypothetical protein
VIRKLVGAGPASECQSVIEQGEAPLRVVVAIIAMFPLAIGLRWLQLFIFTDYRAHFRPIIIPMGIGAVTVAVAMLVWACWPLFHDRRGAR